MLIPWGTTAPVYHVPWSTIGLIVVNVAVFFGTGMGNEQSLLAWGLTYGDGLHPVQWLTHNFIHGNVLHLVGNMLFLWVFGLVVEGKLGWWRFLIVYLGLGIVQGGIEQSLLFWFTEGVSVGASGIIFGLLAMSLVWAPEDDIECYWIFTSWMLARAGAFEIEISILWMAILYIGTNALCAWREGFHLSSAMLHTLGAALGFVVGVILLRRQIVDGEGRDLFSFLSSRHLREPDRDADRLRPRSNSAGDRSDDPIGATGSLERSKREFAGLLAAGRGGAALALYRRTTHFAGKWELNEEALLRLADLLCKERQWDDAAPFIEEYLRRFHKRAVPARLKLAQILVERQRRPRYALQLLDQVPVDELSDKHRALRAGLQSKAQKMLDDGLIELEVG